nr:GerMN domain-containing protein [Thermosipho sp. 1244]
MILLFLFFSLFLFSSEIAFVKNDDIIFLEVGKINSVQEIFEKLSTYKLSDGIKTFVPKDILNAYYFVDTALIIDLSSKSIQNYSIDREVMLVLQILYSLFENINGIDRIYILVDGEQTDIFIKSVNVYFSFPKELYVKKGE